MVTGDLKKMLHSLTNAQIDHIATQRKRSDGRARARKVKQQQFRKARRRNR